MPQIAFETNLNGGVPFTGKLIDELDFKGKTLRISKSIAGAIFMEDVSFKDSEIISGGDIDFSNVEFKGKNIDFSNTTFRCNGDIIFSNAIFADNSNVSFKRAKFFNGGRLIFSGVEFNSAKKVDFSMTEIKSVKGTKFNACNFEKVEEVSFYRANFFGEGIVSFITTKFNTNGLLRFNYVYIEFPEYMEFINTNLSKAILLRTDLNKIKFKRVHFFTPGGNELYDAVKWHEKYRKGKSESQGELEEDLYHIELLYTQLKQNFENIRDFSRAGDFHVGEMEMRRKQYSWPNQYISILNFYRILSNYGQSWKRAFIIFLSGSLIFSLAHPFFYKSPIRVFSKNKEIFEILSSLANEWFITLDFLLLGRIHGISELPLRINGVFGNLLLLIESIFGPMMLALIILALRRHTKR